MLAAVGAGEFEGVGEAGKAWLTDLRRVEPEAAVRTAYDDAYGRYRDLYPALREMFAAGES
jgi:xylulokinase